MNLGAGVTMVAGVASLKHLSRDLAVDGVFRTFKLIAPGDVAVND
jgi:hypothetical protein